MKFSQRGTAASCQQPHSSLQMTVTPTDILTTTSWDAEQDQPIKQNSWPKKTERRNICCFKLLNLDSFARWQEITNAVSLKEMFICSEFWSTFLAYTESFCLKENVLVFCLEVSYFLGNISKQHSPVKGRSNIGLTEILKENLVQTNVLRETFKQNKTKNIVTYKYNRFPVCLTDGKISQ